MKNNISPLELTVSVVLLMLVILLLNPMHFWMPNMLHMTMIGLALVVCSLFIAFIWHEHVRDEREGQHRLRAGRTAFMVGVTVAMIGVAVQSINDTLDQWLVLTLSAMVITKTVGLLYNRINK